MPEGRKFDDQGAEPRFTDRLRSLFLKPSPVHDEPDGKPAQSVEELEGSIKRANDKERLVGLIAAPWAAAIGLLVTAELIHNDPPVGSKLHVSVGLYNEVMIALVVLSILMLVFSLRRKRLYLGIVMALFGLAVFNLHYWGFGIPYIMAAAWYLVRSYRFQRSWREATGQSSWRGSGQTNSYSAKPRASKRYTPPTR